MADKKTIELTLDLIKNIKNKFLENTHIPKSPSYIISKIHRSKIDLNRKEFEAYNRNSKLAKQIYRLYHKKIEEKPVEIKKKQNNLMDYM